MTEEVKRCVEIMHERGCRGCLMKELSLCTYIEEGRFCGNAYHESADLIESLSEQLEQVTRERDAAVRDARGVCRACIHYNGHYPTGNIMSCCKFEECIHGADYWESEDHWQWRGVEVEG